ncbi:MAG TPA: DUF2207 domain-containing protein [Acidimicrobiia bacterium]
MPLAAFLILTVVGIAIGVKLNPEKSFSLPRVSVDGVLAPDGSLRVVEHLTYDFTGAFTYGTRPIPVGSYQISDVSVSEHGRPLTSVGAPYNLQWFFDAKDEQRTFDVAYTVHGAAVAGPDVVELYWKWVGDAHPTIGTVRVTLAVPPGPGRVRAWGHGPLDGVVRISGDTVRWRATSVPQGTFVEGRVATPKARLPALAPTTATPRLPTILTEERAWAVSANRARAEAADAEQRRRDARDILQWVAPLVAALGALGFLLIWLKWGREPPAPDDIGKYFRDLPDDPPAVVDALVHWGHVRPNAFGATVLDLAQRGYLKVAQRTEPRGILPDRTEYVFTRAEHPPALVTGAGDEADDQEQLPEGELRAFERATLDQLFAGGSTITQSELVKHSREHQTESTARWSTFQSSVERSLRARGYLRGKRALPFFLNILIAIIVGLTALGALGVQAWVGGGIAAVWAAVQLALTPLLRQRTPKGQRRLHEWLGVRNYLRDFSQLADAPAGHLVLWERYLVYAVALGVSDQLAHGIEARIPPDETTQFATWYAVGVGNHPGYGSIGSFSESFATSAVSSFTPPSSGGGGGGGFSGGGGGGGGGGGIGAG